MACVHPGGYSPQEMGLQKPCSLITAPRAVGDLLPWALGPVLGEALHVTL